MFDPIEIQQIIIKQAHFTSAPQCHGVTEDLDENESSIGCLVIF